MNLYSLSFIYLFLPLSVFVYYLTPARAKNAILVLISLCFYALAEPRYLPLMVGSVLLDYAACRGMEWLDGIAGVEDGDPGGARRRFLGLTAPSARTALMLLVLVKNAGLVVLLSHFTQNRELWRPLGVLIFAVTSLGYALDVYRYETPCEHNLIDFSLFCVLFTKLPAGPLVRWNEMKAQMGSRRPSLSLISEGAILYIQGLSKKVLLGNQMTAIYDQLAALPRSQLSVVSAWLMTAALALAVYFNLSSLCDMARGLGKMFSIELPRNFYYPYQSRSVTEFVGRFNSTVSSFFSAYLPEKWRSSQRSGAETVFSVAVVTLFWGVWFGFRVNYIIWALYFVLFQLLELLGVGSFLKKLPALFSRIYTFAVVLLSFVIFAGNNVDQSMRYFTTMLGIGGPKLYTDRAMYIASSNYVLLIIAFVLCTSLCDMGLRWLRKKVPVFSEILGMIVNVALLVISTAFLLV
ncbi:MBOAT family O-acyltransferase [Ligaoa zhengdingensis]|uniref:MBOAT family O-acyltransferase n=1 Tax=Ligaoa zhengdingensis TaxID=2763658 RepID=UPI0031BABA71